MKLPSRSLRLFRPADQALPPSARLGSDCFVDASVKFDVPPGAVAPATAIHVGDRVFLGHDVELSVGTGNTLLIDDDTTVNARTLLFGDVRISRYCILAYNVYISSFDHQMNVFPTWLIRDQEAWARNAPRFRDRLSEPVFLHEDCWLGYGVFVKRGVTIGRGAVIGANAVVTHDVPPYSIQGGVPAREIGRRYDFAPPETVIATNEAHWPYFYAGFLMQQRHISESRARGVLYARDKVTVVLRGGKFRTLKLAGLLGAGVRALGLHVTLNGEPLETLPLRGEKFEATLAIPEGNWERTQAAREGILAPYQELELRVADLTAAEWSYALASVGLGQ